MTRRMRRVVIAIGSVLVLTLIFLILPVVLIPRMVVRSEDIPLGSAADYRPCIARAMAQVPGLSVEGGRWIGAEDYYVPDVYEFGGDTFGILVRVLRPNMSIVVVKPLPTAVAKLMLPGPSMLNLMPWRAHPSVGSIFDAAANRIAQECR